MKSTLTWKNDERSVARAEGQVYEEPQARDVAKATRRAFSPAEYRLIRLSHLRLPRMWTVEWALPEPGARGSSQALGEARAFPGGHRPVNRLAATAARAA